MLLAEDDKGVSTLAHRIFGPISSIVQVETYTALFDAINREQYDVVILDVKLKDGGLDMCKMALRTIRERSESIVVLVWSGHTLNLGFTTDEIISAGADAFIEKGPDFTRSMILAILLESIARRKRTNGKKECEVGISALENLVKIKQDQLQKDDLR